MKNIYYLFILLISINSYSQVSFCEDFDSLNVGSPIAETSSSWNTWGELMSNTVAPFADDAMINSLQSYSGNNALYFPGTPAAGPEDILLMFDPMQNITQAALPLLSTPYVVGDLSFSQMMYIRGGGGGGAYFNFQAENTPGVSWALEVNFDATGDLIMSNTSGTSFTSSFPFDIWFEIKFEIDLSNNVWEVFIDGVSQGSFANTLNQISSLDLYPRANDEFWIDDVCFSYTPATLYTNNAQVSNMTAISGLDGQQRYPSVEVRNFGTDPIYSFDITYDYNGTQMTENITNIQSGFGLLSLTAMQIDFPNPITLVGGTNTATATVSNVNGLLQDDNPADDVMSIQITAITPTENKLVIGEEATGTWCGWCPRGAVALNFMDRDYHGYFQGIAVHNGDPMVNTDYDLGISPYIGGYPSALVDRGPEIDPADFEIDFINRITQPISATLHSGAVQNGTTLDVSLTVDVLSNIDNNWKLACVLLEDSVTGSGGTWYQSNSYGSNGITLIDVDGTDWGTLPNWVPDVQMIYRHVARSISPSFDGGNLDDSYTQGSQLTQCFQFTIDPSWDLSQMHIVGMLIDPNNGINNASSESLSTSILNGYQSCNSTSITPNTYFNDKVNIYPNPANFSAVISVNLIDVENILVKVSSIDGKIIAKRDYGLMSGMNSMVLDLSDYDSGIYLIETIIGSDVVINKLIKE